MSIRWKCPKYMTLVEKLQITRTILHLAVGEQWSKFCSADQFKEENRVKKIRQMRWVVDLLKVWYFLSNADDRLIIDGECTAWNKRDRRWIWSKRKKEKNRTAHSLVSASFWMYEFLQEVWHLVRLVMKNHIVKLRGVCLRDI